MNKSKEELGRIHKKQCKELKEVRAKIAKDLGIKLNQSESTYEGYCSGTCPKCKSEELKLNAAILKKKVEDSNVKGRVAVAGFTTVAALSLTGCKTNPEILGGDVEYVGGTENETEDLEGLETEVKESETEGTELEGKFEGEITTEKEEPVTEVMLEGDVALPED